jgi:predicted ATPase
LGVPSTSRFFSRHPSRFAILEGKRRLFFDNFGDGLHYGLAITSAAKTRSNTALFIEEIESHQHPEAIKNLISNLLDISRTNNLQLFITTHNQYVRNYLYWHYISPEKRKKEFRCFHITRDKGTGEVEARIEEGIVNIQEDLHGRPE